MAPTTKMALVSRLLVALTIILMLAPSVILAQLCYAGNGEVLGGFGICNPVAAARGEFSLCCPVNTACMSSGLCSSYANQFYRGGCTDQNYVATVCPAYCIKDDAFPAVAHCGTSKDNFCCDTSGKGDCCSATSNILTIGPAVSSATAQSPTPAKSAKTSGAFISTTRSPTTHLPGTTSSVRSTTASATPTVVPTPVSQGLKIGLGVGVPLGVVFLTLLLTLWYCRRKQKRAEGMVRFELSDTNTSSRTVPMNSALFPAEFIGPSSTAPIELSAMHPVELEASIAGHESIGHRREAHDPVDFDSPLPLRPTARRSSRFFTGNFKEALLSVLSTTATTTPPTLADEEQRRAFEKSTGRPDWVHPNQPPTWSLKAEQARFRSTYAPPHDDDEDAAGNSAK